MLGPEALQDAEVALEATRRDLAGALPHEIEDLTLCHGAAGAADVLLCGAAALGEGWRDAAGLATNSGTWRSSATTPRARVALRRGRRHDAGLFRGLSGIAWWFLRLHDRAIASPLTHADSRLTAVSAGA